MSVNLLIGGDDEKRENFSGKASYFKLVISMI